MINEEQYYIKLGAIKTKTIGLRIKYMKERDDSNFTFEFTKDNLENLFLERFTDEQIKRLLNRMDYNGWTIETLYKRAKVWGDRLEYLSTIRGPFCHL